MNLVVAVTLTLAGPAGGLADAHPVGGLIARAAETVRLHKSLQQVNPMAVSFLPIGIDAPGDARKNMVGQSWHPDMRQNQEAAVVGNQRQALRALLRRPTNPSIPRGTLPGGGAKEQAGQIGARNASHQVSDILPNWTLE